MENTQKNIKERLDDFKALIEQKAFIDGHGLSGEINIGIFTYDIKDEMIVNHFIKQITCDTGLNCNLIECNLYKILLENCEDIDILEAAFDMENEDGSEFLLEQLHSAIGKDEFINKINYAPHKAGDVLLLTGVGDAFPFMRVHSLLEALQPHFQDVPIVVMYPGSFSGHQLRLFNKLKPNDYYRAFNMILGGC